MIFMAKYFIIAAGIWNIGDGIVSLKMKSLKHTMFTDVSRAVRTLLGVGLVIVGFLI